MPQTKPKLVLGALAFVTVAVAIFEITIHVTPAVARPAGVTAASECGQRVTVIGARGSGDPQSGDVATDKYGDTVHGMGKPGAAFAVALANRRPRGQVTFLPVVYPAAGLLGDLRRVGTWGKFINAIGAGAHVGFLGAYTGSVNDGKRIVRQEIADEQRVCPQVKLVLVGYSQGAQVVGDVYGRDLSSAQRQGIIGVVLFGDPYFNPADNAADVGSYDPTRHGVLGTRSPYPSNPSEHVFSICHVHDPICQGPGRIAFSQHGSYQTDPWVKTAAAKLAAELEPPASQAIVDEQSRLRVEGKPLIGIGSTLSAAESAFGSAVIHSSGSPNDPVDCYANWGSLGLTTLFQNFGAAAGNEPCQPSSEFRLSTAALVGHGWRTTKGLKVGDSVDRIKQLYPDARSDTCGSVTFAGGSAGYGLVRKRDPVGGPGAYVDTLCAIVTGAHVAGFGISRLGE